MPSLGAFTRGAVAIQKVTPADVLGTLNPFEAKHAPSALYLAGDRGLFARGPKLSVVGSRKASPEGLRRARKLAARIVRAGGVVVSGLAEGIDSAAHTAAIEAGGKTIAVLGSSLDQPYPVSNIALFREIVEHHLAVSQFPAGTPTQPKNFVLRNRTMALLSDATVIVEAGGKSGTVHQGWEAIRLGRPLFLLESLAENPDLSWPAEMIHYGAEILSDENLIAILGELPSGFLLDAAAF